MFTDERISYFKALPKSIRLNLNANFFMKSEILFIIDETPLSDRDRTIAIKRYTEKMTYGGNGIIGSRSQWNPSSLCDHNDEHWNGDTGDSFLLIVGNR